MIHFNLLNYKLELCLIILEINTCRFYLEAALAQVFINMKIR